MNIFDFIKRYRHFNKLISELEDFEINANIQRLKLEKLASNNKSTLSSYQKKKAEYARGKVEAYKSVIKLFKNFMENGDILNIEEKD
jgi:hypothetical protein